MSAGSPLYGMITTQDLATLIIQDEEILLIDSRSFLEYNTSNISNAVNVCCSKLVKRRLQQNKISVKDLICQACDVVLDQNLDIVVYDQCSEDYSQIASDCFLGVILSKLALTFSNVRLLQGGFLEFQAAHPSLCENKSADLKSAPLTSMSQPCMPVSNIGPTKILPFLYLGSQNDALSEDTIRVNGITYVLNVSPSCPQPNSIKEGHFMRIPVNDNYNAALLPHFHKAFQFLDKVREASGCVLVHCLAGVSRSATIAIAFLMEHLNMTCDEAYRYVKAKRPTISPNFNFLGQLLEYEKKLRAENKVIDSYKTSMRMELDIIQPLSATRTPKSSIHEFSFKLPTEQSLTAQSPTTALAKLNFGQISEPETPMPSKGGLITAFPTTSLDQLNIIPCSASAKGDTDVSSGLLRVKTHLSRSKRPHTISAIPESSKEAAKIQLLSVKSTGAKRPHSISLMDGTMSTTVRSGGDESSINDTGSPASVTPTKRQPKPFVETGSPMGLPSPIEQSVLCGTPNTLHDSANVRSPCKQLPSPASSPLREHAHHLGTTNTSISINGASKSQATKRPLSLGSEPIVEGVFAKRGDNKVWNSTVRNIEPSQVKLRSHKDMKAKRTTVRPNSIAYSTYPDTSDFGDVAMADILSGNESLVCESREPLGKSEQMAPDHNEQETSARKSRSRYRKSKSLEDILSSPEDECAKINCNCTAHKGKKISTKKKSAMSTISDLFTPNIGLAESVQCRCRGSSDPRAHHQSSSSISSSGSHNSLHGSLEIIQVS